MAISIKIVVLTRLRQTGSLLDIDRSEDKEALRVVGLVTLVVARAGLSLAISSIIVSILRVPPPLITFVLQDMYLPG